jgi:hypothetical protein
VVLLQYTSKGCVINEKNVVVSKICGRKPTHSTVKIGTKGVLPTLAWIDQKEVQAEVAHSTTIRSHRKSDLRSQSCQVIWIPSRSREIYQQHALLPGNVSIESIDYSSLLANTQSS